VNAWGAVVFDAASNSAAINTGSTASWTHTPAGVPDYVRVHCAWAVLGANTLTGITYGGNTMNFLGRANSTGDFSVDIHAEIYELVAPPAGAQGVVVTFNTTGQLGYCSAETYIGVDPVTPSGAPVTDIVLFSGSLNTTTNLTVPVTSGNMVSDVLVVDAGSSARNFTSTGTERLNNAESAGTGYATNVADSTSSGSVAMNWVWTTQRSYAHIGAEIRTLTGSTAIRHRVNQ